MAKVSRKRLTDQLDEICKQIIRIRDEFTCQRCGKRAEGRDAHCSHVVHKGNGASWRRFDLLNMKLLCSHCHLYWWHKEPTEAGRWFAAKFPARDEYLEKYRGGVASEIKTCEMIELKDELKLKLSELKGELK